MAVDDSSSLEAGGDVALPGLESSTPRTTDLEAAARRSLQALDAAGVLGPQHAMTMQLILDLARAVGLASRSHASAAAMAAAQLREAWATLPQLADATDDGDEWDRLARELREAAAAERQRHAQVIQ